VLTALSAITPKPLKAKVSGARQKLAHEAQKRWLNLFGRDLIDQFTRHDYVGMVSATPQIADDLLQCLTRQSRAITGDTLQFNP
jgi:hypothetical protein